MHVTDQSSRVVTRGHGETLARRDSAESS